MNAVRKLLFLAQLLTPCTLSTMTGMPTAMSRWRICHGD